MSTVLHAFRTQAVARNMFLRSPATGKRLMQQMRISTEDRDLIFRGVGTLGEAHDLAGMMFSEVVWHFTPPPEVRFFLEARIRQTKVS